MLGRVPAERVGLLIVRAWAEADSPVPLRAVLRLTTDLSSGMQRRLTLTDADEVCDAVRAWLADIVRSAADPA